VISVFLTIKNTSVQETKSRENFCRLKHVFIKQYTSLSQNKNGNNTTIVLKTQNPATISKINKKQRKGEAYFVSKRADLFYHRIKHAKSLLIWERGADNKVQDLKLTGSQTVTIRTRNTGETKVINTVRD
jgi:protease II